MLILRKRFPAARRGCAPLSGIEVIAMFEVYKMMGTDFEGNAVLEPENPNDAYDRLQASLAVADEFQGYGEEDDEDRVSFRELLELRYDLESRAYSKLKRELTPVRTYEAFASLEAFGCKINEKEIFDYTDITEMEQDEPMDLEGGVEEAEHASYTSLLADAPVDDDPRYNELSLKKIREERDRMLLRDKLKIK